MSVSSQIIEKLARSGKGQGLGEYAIQTLHQAWMKVDKASQYHFLDFIPIRLITIIESIFREVTKFMIDEDTICKANAHAFISKIPNKHMTDILFHLDQDSFTVGDIVSNVLSCNRLDDIIASMNSIYGQTFKIDLAQSRERWIEDNGEYEEAFISDIDLTFSVIQRIFEIRHILVHEMPIKKPYRPEEIGSFFEHSTAFVNALTWLATFKIHGVVPRTQSMMNKVSWEKAQETLDELSRLYGKPAEMPEAVKLYDQHTLWCWFAHLAADAQSGLSRGRIYSGTISPLLYASALARLNEWRLKDLKLYPDRFKPEELKD